MSETNGNNDIAQRHSDDCDAVFGYPDPICERCKKISKVIFLKRKNTDNGCSIEEALTASVLAVRLIKQYRLTKGEIVDPEYDESMIAQRQQAQRAYYNQYGAAKARQSHRPRQKWYTWDERRAYDEDLTDDE